MSKKEMKSELFYCSTNEEEKSRCIYLDYDDEKFSIQRVWNERLKYEQYVVINKNTQKVIGIFDEPFLGFIIQYNCYNNRGEEYTFFATSEKFDEKGQLSIYSFDDYLESLVVYKKLSLGERNIDDNIININLGQGTFMFDIKGKGGCIYSISKSFSGKDGITRFYNRIYDKSFLKYKYNSDVNDENIVFVTEVVTIPYYVDEFGMTEVYDVITYGIHSQTLEIVTPIYSSKRNEYIDLLDEPLSKDLNKKWYGKYRDDSVGDSTIIEKIIDPLFEELRAKKSTIDRSADFKKLL